MDIQEKNAPRHEGANEGAQPREGKRPPNRNNQPNRQNQATLSNQPNRPRRPVKRPPNSTGRTEETVTASVGGRDGGEAPRDGQTRPSRAPSPERRGERVDTRPERDRGNRETRVGREGPYNGAIPAVSGGHASVDASDRRSHPATGRPQRMPRRPAQPSELPDMDDLLIEDGMNVAAGAAYEDAPDAAELERILENDVFARHEESIPEVIPEGKVVIVGVRFPLGGKTYYFDPGDLSCKLGQSVIVETARGQEFGEISIANRLIDIAKLEHPLSTVVRIATEADVATHENNRAREEDAFRICLEKIAVHKLDMKLIAAQYTFDNNKLLFYFTAAKRVDFRELVKDLAAVFHIRIELRQIGIRDEARMLGGLGACGRPLCCSTFLSEFGQVSMKMAKEQNLSLNSSKISGCCGRLMCCLRYEHSTYTEEMRKTPAVGTFVNTPDGAGVVTEVFPLQGEVKVSLRGQPDSAPKKYSREVVEPQYRGYVNTPAAETDAESDEPDSED